MGKNKVVFALVIIVVFAIVGAGISLICSKFIKFGDVKIVETSAQGSAAAKPMVGTIVFDPPLPQDAPADIKDAAMLGYNILMDTQKYAPGYVGNKLNCQSCHFKGGITQGGKNGGLSLVGVAATYPRYRKGLNYAEDLVTRTNDCFEKSMNGKLLPPDSKEMTAIVTYFQWISKGLPIYGNITWLGIKHIQSNHKPDPQNGIQIFTQKCAICHGDNGAGTDIAPPLWGNNSFNDGAGMANPENLAAFAHLNMPFKNPDLTVEEALDVAAFVTGQPRLHFAQKK